MFIRDRPRNQRGGQQFGDAEKACRVVGKRAAPFADEGRHRVKRARHRLVDGKSPDLVPVKPARRQAGAAEFGFQLATQTFHSGVGQDQNGAGSGKPLDLVARPDIGKFGGLDEAGGAVRKPKHDNAAAA